MFSLIVESGKLSTNVGRLKIFCLSQKLKNHYTNFKFDHLQIYHVSYKYDELVLIKKQEAAANEENIYGLLLP